MSNAENVTGRPDTYNQSAPVAHLAHMLSIWRARAVKPVPYLLTPPPTPPRSRPPSTDTKPPHSPPTIAAPRPVPDPTFPLTLPRHRKPSNLPLASARTLPPKLPLTPPLTTQWTLHFSGVGWGAGSGWWVPNEGEANCAEGHGWYAISSTAWPTSGGDGARGAGTGDATGGA